MQLSILIARTRKALRELGYTIRKRNQRPEWLITTPGGKWALLTYSPTQQWEVSGPADPSDAATIANTVQNFITAAHAHERRTKAKQVNR